MRLDPSGEVDQETVHYWLGGQLVATREGRGLRFVHTDHLGSSSVATDVSGNAVAGSTYCPCGEHRSSTGAFGTDRYPFHFAQAMLHWSSPHARRTNHHYTLGHHA